ncbi:DDE-type integrase/transposase/recombinase [Desulfitobacterium sp. AusDCA]
MMGFKSFESAGKTIAGIEIMHMIGKGQIQGNRNVLFEVEFINQIMGLIA